jgi:tRNA 2-selenouridine synthase
MNEFIEASDFRRILIEQIPIIDVRAPVEFVLGSVPGSVNLPLLQNEERHQVGTTYKQKGQAAAVALGHEFQVRSKRHVFKTGKSLLNKIQILL